MADQLRPFELGCYGNALSHTPHIDRLAAQGVRFEVACSNNPVCTPARACLLTGQYSRTCMGMRGNVGDPTPERNQLCDTTLAEAARAAGYDTALIGKWHLQPQPDLVGFDSFVYPAFLHHYRGRTYYDHSGRGFAVEGWSWDYEMEMVRHYLSARRNRPFFLYFNIEPPHMPLADAPERYTRLYRREQVHLRPNAVRDGRMACDNDWFRVYLWDHLFYQKHQPHTERLPDDFDLRDLVAMHWGMVRLVDDQIGRLVRALDENHLAENTILLFTADHGDNLGSHGCFNKERLCEESIRVPLIVRWPRGLKPGNVTTQVASLVDVMPTLLGLAGVAAPASVQGVDLSPVVTGRASAAVSNAAFIEALLAGFEPRRFGSSEPLGGAVGIRTPHHLYAVALQDASAYRYKPENDVVTDDCNLFFDLRDDPYQLRNLAGTGQQAATAAELRERLLDWHQRTSWLSRRI